MMSDPESQVTQTQEPPVTADDTALESPTTSTSPSVSPTTNHKQLDHSSDGNDASDAMPVSDADNGYDAVSNGHLCPNETMTNGVTTDQSSQGSQSPVQIYSSPDVTTEIHNGVRKSHTSSVTNLPDPSTNQGTVAGVMSSPSTSPSCYSVHTNNSVSPHSGDSPHSNPGGCVPGGSPPHGQQHVVHVHVNPGETFSVRVGDQIQHIQGPATVRMVSNNGPPMPMPMQVPIGHMVQQIVDENGILTHVILSPQPPGIPGPPMTVGYYGGPNGTPPQQMYPTYGPQFAPAAGYPTAAQYPGPAPAPHGAPPGPPHIHHPVAAVPPHVRGTPPPAPAPCNNQSHIHLQQEPQQQSGPPMSHHNHGSLDDRTQRQKQKLQDKLSKRHKDGGYPHHRVSSPRRAQRKMNGDMRKTEPVNSCGTEGPDLVDERRVIRNFLSKMTLPKVSEIENRSVLIQLSPPECNQQEFDIYPSEFHYELWLSEKGRDGKYKLVYSGDATEITLKDLKPATEYHLRVCSLLDDLKGDQTEAVSFKTDACEADPPQPPKLSSRTRTSLLLKWNATSDNGSKISSYALECDQSRRDQGFVEVYNGIQRQFKVAKLAASTGYTFRLAAINAMGKSDYSDTVVFYTSGSVPATPDAPTLTEAFVHALTITWTRRANDDQFTLQMEDDTTGHGFLPVFSGPELSHRIKNLKRNTAYKFRLRASNEEGDSKWSETVCYHTLPDKPAASPRPQLKGRAHAASFRVAWEPPKDNGGAEIVKYLLELDHGRGYECMYEGLDREFHFDHLHPGRQYRVRVCCFSAGGRSEWSDVLVVSTLAVAPGPCPAPKLQGKPRANFLHLRWDRPDYDGGAAIQEYEVLMTNPDNTTRNVYAGRDQECAVAGLLPGRPYLFQVRPTNKAGAGPWSDIFEVVSGAGVPDPPKPPVVYCRSAHGAVVSWEEPVNNGATVTEYRLEWQYPQDGGDFAQLYIGPTLSYEVRSLTPATLYNFRVQALNSAGAGPFSGVTNCVMPSSSPGAVVSLRASATATSIHLMWKEPVNNGSAVTSYNIDIGEKYLISVENTLGYDVDDLTPETTYKIRVQAVNSIGVGAFSTPIKVTTRSLPPSPPCIECVSAGPNNLKLKWGDGKNPDLIQYCLEMLRDNGSFHPIFHGTSHGHKVNKLAELTDYQLRIYASNEVGDGPYSCTYTFRTTKAPPPAVRPPKICDITTSSCTVEWTACKPMGRDTLVYVLQLQCRNQEYTQVFRGSQTSYTLTKLQPKTDYAVRVCAVRLCSAAAGEASDVSTAMADLTGAFSPGVSFTTLSPSPVTTATTLSPGSGLLAGRLTAERKQLSDQQWAMIILLGFTVCAIVIAFIAQQIIAYTSHTGGGGGATDSTEP